MSQADLGQQAQPVARWAADAQAAWRAMACWPVLAWLRPVGKVHLTLPDGTVVVHNGKAAKPAPKRTGPGRFNGVVIPDEWVLFMPLSLPALAQAERAAAVELAARENSPFAPDDLVWAFRAGWLALASRQQLGQCITALANEAAGPGSLANTEVWLAWPDGHMAPVPGLGDDRRARHERHAWLLNAGLVGVAVALATGLALTPALQLRQRTLSATQAHARLMADVAPEVKLREEHVHATELLAAAAKRMSQPLTALEALDRLSTAVPDDAFLQSLQLTLPPGEPVKVSMAGLTANAPALMKQLGAQPGFGSVKAPTAAVRATGATRETFNVELAIEPLSPTPAQQP